jgi:hypothetical protein
MIGLAARAPCPAGVEDCRSTPARVSASRLAPLTIAREYLRDAERQRDACERIVELLADAHDRDQLTAREREVWRIAIGPIDTETADAVRAVVAAARKER